MKRVSWMDRWDTIMVGRARMNRRHTLETVWLREVVVFEISEMASTIAWPSQRTLEARKNNGRIVKRILNGNFGRVYMTNQNQAMMRIGFRKFSMIYTCMCIRIIYPRSDKCIVNSHCLNVCRSANNYTTNTCSF